MAKHPKGGIKRQIFEKTNTNMSEKSRSVMFNKEILEKQLSQSCSKSFLGAKVTAILILKRTYKMSRLIKKFDTSKEDLKNNCFVYLADNYERLEEGLKDAASNLFSQKAISARALKSRYLFAFYNYLKSNAYSMNEKELFEFFETVNLGEDYPDLQDAVNMLMYFKCALSFVILDVFEKLLKDGAGREEEKKLFDLFTLLQTAENFDEKSILLSHPVEKVLLSDPAGLYDKLSENTKSSYRKNLEHKARKKKINTLCLAKEIVSECSAQTQHTKRHIGLYLCDKAVLGNVYIVLLVFLAILFTVLLCIVSPFFVLTFFAVFTSTRLLLDKIFQRFTGTYTLPCLELSEIPENHGVIIVITSLLTGNKSDEELFSRLEMLYFLCRGKNVYFGLLCDLCDSDTEFSENDKKIFENANGRVRQLREKYGEFFYLFLRQREYSRSEQKYIAPERKRGAVSSLAAFLCNKEDGFCSSSIKPSYEDSKKIKYVFTLDADTNIEFDCLKKAVGIMMHPQNVPVYDKEKHAVVKGYGIIQPSVAATPKSCNENFFTSVLCGHGGISSYETGIVDGAMCLFERSIFVGKGMFEKNVYYEALCGDNSFENESVLSHDAPEGARLGCAHVNAITLTDSFPQNELSYYKRLHRWIRGDIQNIPFLFKGVKTRDGKKIKNSVGAASRLFIFENIKNAFLSVFTVICLFCSLMFERETQILIVTVSLSAYVLPFVYSVLSTFRKTFLHNYRRLFFSKGIYSGIVSDFLLCVFKICALAKTSYVSLDAIVRSLYRMLVSKKNLLEWTTSAQNDTEKNDGLLGYVKKNIVSAFLGVLLYVNSDNSFLKLIGLAWFFMPYFSYVFCKKKIKNNVLLKEDRENLLDYCRDMWLFFEHNVTQKTNFLPPDNISYKNGGKLCQMTSPTNIGLYLVSICVCEKLGILSVDEACKKLKETLVSVEKLPKYKGLLYNWYDIYKNEPMSPMYVSSVDEGNFAACLFAVKGALSEYGKTQMTEKILNMLSKLIEQSDMSFMYNKKRELFYIGFTVSQDGCVFDKNCYDMLMSEARILSFVACAQRLVNSVHYKRLSRRFVEGDGYLGLASWSGTMFEYFMPELFFESEKSTLLYEALSYAVHFSKKTSAYEEGMRVYGISESCYNSIDKDGNYKYKAFGVGELAVDVIPKRLVISPYSSFLAVGFEKYCALQNLKNIRALGGYGKYGFYESIDFDNKNDDGSLGVVKCFMSHHIGMSILSCANRIFDGVVCRWFLSDKNNLAFYSFTKEQIPYNVYIKKNAIRQYDLFFKIKQANITKQRTPLQKSVQLLCNSTKIDASKEGVSFLYDNLEIFKKTRSKTGLYAALKFENKEIDIISGAKMICKNSHICFVKYPAFSGGKRFMTRLLLTLDKNTADIVRIKLEAKLLFDTKEEQTECVFSFVPLLESSMEGSCPFFDKDTGFEKSKCENNTLKYYNKKSGIYMYAGLFEKENSKDISAFFADNKSNCTFNLKCSLAKEGFECELVLSISNNQKCAEMGIVRSRERDFETASKILLEQKTNQNKIKQNDKSKRVLGASVVKEEVKTQYSVQTMLGQYKLLCGKSFASVVLRDGLGFSFSENAREGEVSRYFEKNGTMQSSERMLFGTKGEFDLAKMAKETKMYPFTVQYEGDYCKDIYRMTAFVSSNMPYKTVVVETTSQSPVGFWVTVSEKLSVKKEISGGVLFFSDGKEGAQTGFLTGFCIREQTEVCQARLDFCEDKISAFFDFDKDDSQTLKKYVFVLGKANSIDKAYLYQSTAKRWEEELKGADRLAKRLYINWQKIPSRLYQVLSLGFEIPKESINFRALVKTQSPIFEFYSLLLVYTQSELKTERILRGFMQKNDDIVSRLLLYVSLCEYTRLYEKNGLCEKMINKESLYRISAKNIVEIAKDVKNTKDDFVKTLFLYTLDRVMSLCRNLQDMPAYYKLLEIKKMFF